MADGTDDKRTEDGAHADEAPAPSEESSRTTGEEESAASPAVDTGAAPAAPAAEDADEAADHGEALAALQDAIGELVAEEAAEDAEFARTLAGDSLRLRTQFGARDPDDEAPLPGPVMTDATRRAPMPLFDAELWSDWHVRMSVVGIAILLFYWKLGSFGLWDPWEVHYGAVGWGMVERGDWISPWWGSYWTAPGKTMEGEYFFSKPVLLLWMMGMGMQMFGFTEFGIRFGIALIAVLGVSSVYLAGSRIWSRKVGVLMALVLATSPLYTMIGRQAQTDMPFVGLMTVALSFFMMGVFGRDRNRKVDKFGWALFVVIVLAIVVPQLQTITVGQLRWRTELAFPERLICYGPTQLGIYLLMIGVFFVTAWRSPNKTRGQLYLYVFYAFVGLATMGKGILGFALPGATIAVYLVVSREWGLLKRVELFRGVLLAIFVGFPWYGAMFARHGGIGGAFYQRFIIHDHFKRLATGVHQIDTGSFEHFIKWLAYGLFPWGSFVPAAFARALSGEGGSARSDEGRARMFLFVWFAIAFALFTLSSTKFHHYIFPAVPALAMLSALFLADVIDGKVDFDRYWPMYLAAVALFVLIGFDLMSEPQHLKNMFTYKYDRAWRTEEWTPGFQAAIRVFFAIGAVGMVLLAAPRRRAIVLAGTIVLGANAFAFGWWALNDYMPTISESWSQKGIWDAYYDTCTRSEPPRGTHRLKAERYCQDSAISYKLNWRGETYYTMNEVIPIRDDEEWNYFIEQNDGRCFYAILERSRIAAFRSGLPAEQRGNMHEVHNENIKFVLMATNCSQFVEEESDEDAEGSGEGSDEPGAGR